METEFRDSQWQRDYQTALAELMGGPHQLLLPAPERIGPRVGPIPQPQGQYSIPVQEHGPFNPDLEGYALREEILRHMTVKKTETPYIREVRLDGQIVGKVARSPYQAMFWLSSLDRRTPFTSMVDAALHTVVKALL